MDNSVLNNNQPNPGSGTQNPNGESAPITPAPSKPGKFPRKLAVPAGVTGIILLFVTAFALSGLMRVKTTPSVLSEPTPAPTVANSDPDRFREIYPAATASAFRQIEADLATVAGELESFSVEDQSVIPPAIELPLGFQNE